METVGYSSPTSLKEAVELRGKHKEECRVLAGGTDLLVRAKVTGQWPAGNDGGNPDKRGS